MIVLPVRVFTKICMLFDEVGNQERLEGNEGAGTLDIVTASEFKP